MTPTMPPIAPAPRLTRRGFLAASGVVGAAGIAGGAAWASLAELGRHPRGQQQRRPPPARWC